MIVSTLTEKTDMKTKHLFGMSCLLLSFAFFLVGCANDGKDSVEKADSINRAGYNAADSLGGYRSDASTSRFLVRAANSGMAEVKASQLATDRSTRTAVKQIANTMIEDHQKANDRVKELARMRNIALPDSLSESKKRRYDDLVEEKNSDFDRSYVNRMIDDHEDAIDLFEDAVDDVRDADVREFAQNTLPKLRNHLDMLRNIKKDMR
jgi:putative membrane protein